MKKLPSANWLRKNGYAGLLQAMKEAPDLFKEFELEPVDERALVRRINRKLTDGQRLRVARTDGDLGRYYILDAQDNLVAWKCDLEEIARELGALGACERMAA
jgi:hypothetical protein